LLASLTGSESAVANVEAPLSLSLTGALSLGGRSMHAGFAAGLSESSADLLVYAGLRFGLFSRAPVF
jgi:hypothetical protein